MAAFKAKKKEQCQDQLLMKQKLPVDEQQQLQQSETIDIQGQHRPSLVQSVPQPDTMESHSVCESIPDDLDVPDTDDVQNAYKSIAFLHEVR